MIKQLKKASISLASVTLATAMLTLSGCASGPKTNAGTTDANVAPKTKSQNEVDDYGSASEEKKTVSTEVVTNEVTAKKATTKKKPAAKKKLASPEKTKQVAKKTPSKVSVKKPAVKASSTEKTSTKTESVTKAVAKKTTAPQKAVAEQSKAVTSAERIPEKNTDVVIKPDIKSAPTSTLEEDAAKASVGVEVIQGGGVNISTLDQLPHALSDGWTLDVAAAPGQSAKQCLLTQVQGGVFDGYEETTVTVSIDLNNIWVSSRSNLDLTYPDTGLEVLDSADAGLFKRAFKSIGLESTAVVDMTGGALLPANASKLVVKMGFWPTWPVTETRIIAYPIENPQTLVSMLEDCASLLN